MESTLNSRTALGIQGEKGTTGSTIGAIYGCTARTSQGSCGMGTSQQDHGGNPRHLDKMHVTKSVRDFNLAMSKYCSLLTSHNKEQSCAFPAPFIQNQARRYKRSRSWNQMTSSPLRTCKMPRSQVGLCGLGGLLCYICSCKKYTRASTTCT